MQAGSEACGVCAVHRHCTGTCWPCSAPWPRRRSSSPTCLTRRCGVGPAVWPSTTWAVTGRPGTGTAGQGWRGASPSSDSRVFAAASLKVIPCDHLSTQGGEQHRKLPFFPDLPALSMKTALCGSRWGKPLLPPSGQVLGAGPRGLLGGGHVRGFWPIGHHPGAVPAHPGQ